MDRCMKATENMTKQFVFKDNSANKINFKCVFLHLFGEDWTNALVFKVFVYMVFYSITALL